MKKSIAALILMMICLTVQAAAEAPGEVKGKIVDSKTKEAVEFVNVSVTPQGSKTLVKGTISDQAGNFIIGGLKNGNYTITISYIGYKDITKNFTVTKDQTKVNFRQIMLSEDSKMLDEVQVVAQKSQMKFEIDKKVFNVDQNIASTGGSASDVLTNIPSVEVDNEGSVSLRGSSSVTVWINGKASGLSSDNRGEILDQMPAESIEKIEVITNPSAKYSPEGTAGIINIVLKRDRKAGYYGSAQAGVNTKGGYNASGNINYSSGVLDAYANVGYRRRKNDSGGYSDRTYSDGSALNSVTDGDRSGGNLFTRAGATWHATKKDHLSLGGMGIFGNSKNTTGIDYIYTPSPTLSGIDGYTRNRTTNGKNNMRMYNVELGYKHDFSDDHTIDFTLSHFNWHMDGKNSYDDQTDYVSPTTPDVQNYQYQESNIRSNNWEVQLDYVNKFSKNSRIEAGYKGTLGRENSPVSTWEGTNKSNMQFVNDLYNRFKYNQDIHAIYATYGGRAGKFGFQVGLRGEYWTTDATTYEVGDVIPAGGHFTNDYFRLFPSAYLTYSLPKNNELQLNYTRRIRRPWGGQLNSFRNITDPTNISYGNPKLTPEYSDSYELNYIKNWDAHTLSVSTYYRPTSDVIQGITFITQDAGGNDIMNSTSANVAKSQTAGLEIVAKDKLFKILDLTTTVNLFYYKLDGYSYQPTAAGASLVTGKGNENFSWNAKMIANFMLPASFSLQLTGNYNGKQIIAQGYRKPNYSVDAGLRKSFADKKWSLSVNARDIFNSRKFHNITSGTGFEQDTENWRGGRRVNFTLTYSFGNMRAKKPQGKKQTDGNNSGYETEIEE